MESDNALKVIDILGNGGFEANGKKYFLEPHVSPERFRMMNEYQIELSYSTTFKKMYADLTELRNLLNKAEFVESAVKLRDIQEGMIRLTDRNNHHPILKYCALILNTHEEDRKIFDEKLIEEKISDWQEAGVPISSFFPVVLHTVSGLRESLKDVTQSTSEKTNPKKS